MPLLTVRQMSERPGERGDGASASSGQDEGAGFFEEDFQISKGNYGVDSVSALPIPLDDPQEVLEPWQPPLTATPLDEAFDPPGDFSEPLPLEAAASLTQDALGFPDTTFDDSAHNAQEDLDANDALPPSTPDSDEPPLPPASSSLTVEIPECALVTPRSCYEPFDAGAPVMSEAGALAKLAAVRKRLRKPAGDFIEYNLDDFAVYCDTEAYPCEMRPLHHLDTRTGFRNFFFDGILSVSGESKIFVKRVPIAAMPIDNYGDVTKHTVHGRLWLQSELNRKRTIYYRLGQPVREYARFFKPLLWVADLAKHFVDYLAVMGASKRKLEQHPSEDFRTSIVANVAFLHKETIGVLGTQSTYFHTIWSEIWDFSRYKAQPRASNPHTVVTQYMYDLFEHMPFGDQLEVVPISAKTEGLRNRLIQECHLELPSALHDTAKSVYTAAAERIRNIKPGDTISTKRDDEHSGTLWKREVSRGFADIDRWFARVQTVTAKMDGTRVFDVIWYYRPVDTLCGLMKYPWNNELFLSDHCSCAERHKISEDEVLGVHDVDFVGASATRAEFFCRQTYFHAERKWTTLRTTHLYCKHTAQGKQRRRAASPSQYRVGDTLLVHMDTASGVAEPCELAALYREEGRRIYRFRRLPRRRDVEPGAGARPNELVYGEALVEGRRNRIVGRCHVRVFAAGARIPTPYDGDGVGAYFFITHGETRGHGGVRRWAPLGSAPAGLRQGWDPASAPPRLRGFDLFCGGGNFGRGLEDGGGVEMRWANDCDAKAVHTYMANAARPGAVAPFLGSIDDLQRLAIEGRFARAVPPIGDVDFVSGGSPCPGFSRLTNDKTTAQQRKNQSLVGAGRDTSNSYGRLFPQRFLETIVTTPNPGDAKNGRALHWREGRVLTIMEARRAQGLRDTEVLLGNPSTQYKLVGNSLRV
ncbi:DNA (cytosine-5)-methyltransferase PliMCI [Tolypocladium ophioglossoides CBS 100239]|uniref:DNA (cytosine-5-)-methyltransferase n=1 Tax=Tolypocladium ophioglossoides (strain CBS 100239) TaxID=1163406 RepID=A0A0L0N697_TOLOC|nr:DNA (cytosine-5)-methyltransferase PliMCI [Tolypocladium ophioglossoides CBS 100239]